MKLRNELFFGFLTRTVLHKYSDVISWNRQTEVHKCNTKLLSNAWTSFSHQVVSCERLVVVGLMLSGSHVLSKRCVIHVYFTGCTNKKQFLRKNYIYTTVADFFTKFAQLLWPGYNLGVVFYTGKGTLQHLSEKRYNFLVSCFTR